MPAGTCSIRAGPYGIVWSSNTPIDTKEPPVTLRNDLEDLHRYLTKRFKSDDVRIVPHPKKTDMAEVYIGEEFIAPLYREEEDGEISYQLQIVILDVDLEDDGEA